jgi:hypothetical protein
MIDGSSGDALTRKGNSSITTGMLRSPTIRNRSVEYVSRLRSFSTKPKQA